MTMEARLICLNPKLKSYCECHVYFEGLDKVRHGNDFL